MKFTKEIKKNWIEALESGNYIQGKDMLLRKKNSAYNVPEITEYCCLGVLREVIPITNVSPMDFLEKNGHDWESLAEINDDKEYWNNNPPQDYSNVLPLIKKLETNG